MVKTCQCSEISDLFYFYFLFIFCNSLQCIAQNSHSGDYIYYLTQTGESILIDGVGDEQSWQTAQVASDFILNAPIDNAPPARKTEVRMFV